MAWNKGKKRYIVPGILLLCVVIGIIIMVCMDSCVTITAPDQVVCSYNGAAAEYLTSQRKVVNFVEPGMTDAAEGVVFSWECDREATQFLVEYATDWRYSDGISVVTSQKQITVYNLYKATKYYLRVTAYNAEEKLGTDATTFETTDIGPRVIHVDGLYNVRDVGGYQTESGKATLQGLAYRGCEMNGVHDIVLTEAGNDTMSNVLCIAHDMDLRDPSESGGATESPVSSATLNYYTLGAYQAAFREDSEMYRQVFAALAEPENYPVYIHCWGGADRTGTVCFLLNALLGVSEEDMIKDYEFTSFSIFGIRDAEASIYAFKWFLEDLKEYEGDTLSQKTENYLLSIGVEQWQIDNIRGILFGQIPVEITPLRSAATND